jgi:predicted RND superfamily exporter protein
VFLGFLTAIGWELGQNECIFLIGTVGLSVDYTVHLLHAYNHAHVEGQSMNRLEKSQSALSEMGISVLSSAITTLLAALILFFCNFYFFFQFGVFIFIVIGLSILSSLTLLMPVVMMIGPNDDQGKIPAMAFFSRHSGRLSNSGAAGQAKVTKVEPEEEVAGTGA